MNDTLKGILCEMGLPYDSTDEAAQAFFDALNDDLKAEVTSKLEAKAAAAQAEADSATADANLSAKDKAKVAERANGIKVALAAVKNPQTRQQVVTGEGDKVIQLESQRVAQVNMLASTLKIPSEVAQLSIAHGEDVIQARTRFLKHLTEECKPITGVRVGQDNAVKSLVEAIPDAIQLRAGSGGNFYTIGQGGKVERDERGKPQTRKAHERAHQLASHSVLDMYRQYLIALGVPADEVMRLSRPQLADLLGPRNFRRAFGQFALVQGTSDFDNILADSQGKTLRTAYIEKQATWQAWARRATTPDFKPITRTNVSDAGALLPRLEGGEFKYVQLSDSKETYSLAEYGHIIRLTRRALINDDLDAFSRIPTYEAAAARRKEDDLVYAVLTANAAMSDTVALFHATHGNLISATAAVGAPSIAALGAMRAMMRKQTGPKGGYLNLVPRYIIVPPELELVAEQFASSNYVAALATSVNPFAPGGSTPLKVIVEPRLSASSTTAWYLAADSDEIDTVEISFLQDEPEPVLKQETDFDTDDQKFAVRHTAAAAAIDYRGLVKNPGV